jgi:hypothetical protein
VSAAQILLFRLLQQHLVAALVVLGVVEQELQAGLVVVAHKYQG